ADPFVTTPTIISYKRPNHCHPSYSELLPVFHSLFLTRDRESSYPFKYLSIIQLSIFKSRANWILLIYILELSINKFNFGKSSSPLISVSVHCQSIIYNIQNKMEK